MDSDRKPWEQQPRESAKVYAAFVAYRDLGPGRSLRKLAQTYSKSLSNLMNLSQRWDWPNRVNAYDAHMAAIAQAAREEVERKEAELWARRRQELREREWNTAHALLERAEMMLNVPLFKKVSKSEDGKTITEVHPMKWTQADAARFVDAASKLARLATEMITDRQQRELTGLDGGPIQFQPVVKEIIVELPKESDEPVDAG